jgi:hypothetical protein
LFTSDDIGQYSEAQKAEFEEALSLRGSHIRQIFELEPDVWKIDFEQDGSLWSAFCNLTQKEKGTPLPNGTWVELRPFETMVLKS